MMFDIKSIILFLGVIFEGEEDGFVINFFVDGVKGFFLFGGVIVGSIVVFVVVGLVVFEVKSFFVRVYFVENVELVFDEFVSIFCFDVGVEESVDVSIDNIDGGVEGSGDFRVFLDIEGFGDCLGVGVVVEFGFVGGDEFFEFVRSVEIVYDGFVIYNDKFDGVLVSLGSNGVDLFFDIVGVVRVVVFNEDIDNEFYVVFFVSGGDGFEGVVVSGVDVESGEVSGFDGNDIFFDSVGIYVVIVVRVVRGVGNGVMVVVSFIEFVRDG